PRGAMQVPCAEHAANVQLLADGAPDRPAAGMLRAPIPDEMQLARWNPVMRNHRGASGPSGANRRQAVSCETDMRAVRQE
ncbi:MAG TPA: hypothetical protein VKD22_14210, partial [Ramlibacter sp.]|nr:hypothetical protein [Ramlibacter sp.]